MLLPIFMGSTRADALVKGWSPPEEQALSVEANGNNPLGIVIEPSQESQTNQPVDKADYPDLGSDQVFPFVAGLDSYSNY